MSLKKIAEVKKRKRRFYDGGGGGDYGGGFDGGGYEGGYDGGDYGGYNDSDYNGATANDAAQFGTPDAPAGTGASYSGGDTSGGNFAEGNAFTGGLGGGSSLSSNLSDLGVATVGDTGSVAAEYGGGDYGLSGGEYGNPAAASSVAVPNQIGTALSRMAPALSRVNPALGALAAMGSTAFSKYGGLGSVDLAGGLLGAERGTAGQNTARYDHGEDRGSFNDAQPFGGDTPAQTTPTTGPGAPGAGNTGMRQYVWDPAARQYRLTNLGAGSNPMGYQQGQVFQMAAGGRAPSGISAGMPRFVQGGGTGLSDSVPVKMDDGGQGRLADGEFVVPADVVSGLGGGSSSAGSKMLFDMMERIRQQAHGKSQQIRPVNPQQVLPM